MAATGDVTTFAELDAAANRLSRLLRAAGVQPGDHVAFCMENHPRYLEVAWGCHYAGAVYTAASSRLTSGELSYILRDCEAKVFITSKYKADQATEIIDDTPGVTLRLMLDGTVDGYESYEAAVEAQTAEPLDDRIAGTDMLYSSGTTGLPKGVTRAFVAEPLETAADRRRRRAAAAVRDDRRTSVYLSPAPLYHAAPLRFCMSTNALGATVVVMEHFDAEEYLQLIERYRVTHTQVVPTMFVRLLKLPEDVRARYDVSSLQCVIHAAAPCPVPVKQQMIEWFGPVHPRVLRRHRGQRLRVLQQRAVAGAPGHGRGADRLHAAHRRRRRRGAAARRERHDLLRGRRRSSSTTTTPRRRRARGTRKGWSTLGDVGYVDDDGFLFLTDRKAYMIISGGVNIYPQEAENVLVTHPKVVDVAVFGVPNDDFGEEVKAVVQPVEMPADAEEADALAKELIAFCRDAPGRRQVPPLDRLPRRAPPPPDRQALQAPPQGRVLDRRRPQHLTFLTLLAPARAGRETPENAGASGATSTGASSGPTAVPELGVGEAPERRPPAARRSGRPACAPDRS